MNHLETDGKKPMGTLCLNQDLSSPVTEVNGSCYCAEDENEGTLTEGKEYMIC